MLQSYRKLEDRAQFDLDFVLLTTSAAAICAFGFKMNSPSVIIGAMVLSPLLLSIVAIGADVFQKKWRNTFRNLFSFFLGISIAVAISFFICKLFPFVPGSEITGRIVSGRSDYFLVAFISGLAGTFAYFWPGIIEAIAGIAISVALIPPVVMVGIGLANWDVSLLKISLTIVLMNVSGILIGSVIIIFGLHWYVKKK